VTLYIYIFIYLFIYQASHTSHYIAGGAKLDMHVRKEKSSK